MNYRIKTILTIVLIVLGAIALPSRVLSQDASAGENANTEAAAQAKPADDNNPKASGGLGNLFATALQDMLKKGKMFVPNGESATPSEPGKPGEPEKFKLNFNNAPVDQILKFLSDMKKKVVLKSDQVQGNYTIMNPNEVTQEEAMNIIDAAFGLKGTTYIETDQMILILPIADAKKMGVDVKVGTGDQDSSARVTSTVIDLKYASPSQLKESLAPLMPENANVIADDRTGSIIITDTAANTARLEKIIRQLDKEGALEGVAIRVFKLRYLNASEMSRSLNDLLENIVVSKMTGGNRQDRRRNANVEVIGDRSTNSLIISAPQEAIQEVSDFIEKLDVSATAEILNETFTMKNGNATEIAQGLNQMLQSRSSQNYRPTVVADQRSNTVIISAYPEDVKTIKDILVTLDAKKSYDKITRVYPLEHADAIILSGMLKQLIGEGDSSSNRGGYYYDYYYSYSRRGRGGEEDQIKIIEDQRLNALIITARPSDFDMIEDLIKQLDQPLPESKEEPRVYPIKYARASDLAYIINELFSDQQSGGGFFFFYQQQQSLTGLSGKVKVIADTTTNSIVVIAGTPRAFDVVEKLIKQLDQKNPEYGTTKVFPLKNAEAEYMSQQLTSLFEEQRGGNQRNQGFYWFMNQSSANQNQQISNLIGNVRIVAETRTNSLLVTTNSQYFEPIGELINELDQDIAQMLIEILIVEISDIKNNELGIKWADNLPINVEANLETPISALNLDRVAVLSSANYSAVLNMLAHDEKTNVVARPNILTKDNQSAYVEVINEVPVLGGSTISNNLSQQSIEFKQPGLKLSVKPRINSATTVTINVNLETGQVLVDRYSLKVGDTIIPAFAKRVITTVLTIDNEETAVLSGVLDTSYSDIDKGIPGLKSVPILGYLFKSKSKRKSNTELLTFITPFILQTPEDRQRILRRQSERMERYGDFMKQLNNLNVEVGIKPN
ncbi:MAG: secretin N-terminal domain-containing protein [Candidatus Omnitrophota bacterium]